ncbi:unnamed protein product [Caenorhabditis auriculariae]|uniref:Oxidative stress-responsive serine-rich protein 1 n=1 Tax=Caenorhabditis auriculariae TaxID=2777116 RepID=A0A8S1GNF2_9PELO|nr:unnamed protein product [Caenorhabditis auriculariae]
MAAEETLTTSIGLEGGPSTSTTFSFFEKDEIGALFNFEKLAIGSEGPSTRVSSPTPPRATIRCTTYRCGRYTPYFVHAFRRRRTKPTPINEANVEEMAKIRLRGEVEALKLCLLDRKDINTPCSVQAARPPSPDEAVDELSEYFTHFVRVGLKMSALAESMYV